MRPKHLLFWGAAVGALCGTYGIGAQDLGRPGVKENLDLPLSVVESLRADDEEDTLEVVELYGHSFEGGGFVFLGGPTG